MANIELLSKLLNARAEVARAEHDVQKARTHRGDIVWLRHYLEHVAENRREVVSCLERQIYRQ